MSLGKRNANAQHEQGAQKHAVVSSDWWEFKPGQKVMTCDGFMGTVTAVTDGPHAGNEQYEVTLDNGMGGGSYAPGQLKSARQADASVHTAADDYPELSAILVDRPDIAPNQKMSSVRRYEPSALPCQRCGGMSHLTGEHSEYYNGDDTYTRPMAEVVNDSRHWNEDDFASHQPVKRCFTCGASEGVFNGVPCNNPEGHLPSDDSNRFGPPDYSQPNPFERSAAVHPVGTQECQEGEEAGFDEHGHLTWGGKSPAGGRHDSDAYSMFPEKEGSLRHLFADHEDFDGPRHRYPDSEYSGWEMHHDDPDTHENDHEHCDFCGSVDHNSDDHTQDDDEPQEDDGYVGYDRRNGWFAQLGRKGHDNLLNEDHAHHMMHHLMHEEGYFPNVWNGGDFEQYHTPVGDDFWAHGRRHFPQDEQGNVLGSPGMEQHGDLPADEHDQADHLTGHHDYSPSRVNDAVRWGSMRDEHDDAHEQGECEYGCGYNATGHQHHEQGNLFDTDDMHEPRHPEPATTAPRTDRPSVRNPVQHPEDGPNGECGYCSGFSHTTQQHHQVAQSGGDGQTSHTITPESYGPISGDSQGRNYDEENPFDYRSRVQSQDPERFNTDYIDRAIRGEASLNVFAFLVDAAADEEFRFHLTASWNDVRNKAKRLKDSGFITIVSVSDGIVNGVVRGDHHIYETQIQRLPGRTAVATWQCGCKWASYAWGRSPRYKHLEGRMCSHALGLHYEAQARGMFGRQVNEDTQRPQWLQAHSPIVIQWNKDRERNETRRAVPPGNMRRTFGSYGDMHYYRQNAAPSAYIYGADIHCPGCANDEFQGQQDHPMYTDLSHPDFGSWEGGDDARPSPISHQDLDGDPHGYHCGTCGGHISDGWAHTERECDYGGRCPTEYSDHEEGDHWGCTPARHQSDEEYQHRVNMHHDGEEDEDHDGCPACGESAAYGSCQGHGSMGDPEGADILRRHDDGDHTLCHPNAECHDEQAPQRAARDSEDADGLYVCPRIGHGYHDRTHPCPDERPRSLPEDGPNGECGICAGFSHTTRDHYRVAEGDNDPRQNRYELENADRYTPRNQEGMNYDTADSSGRNYDEPDPFSPPRATDHHRSPDYITDALRETGHEAALLRTAVREALTQGYDPAEIALVMHTASIPSPALWISAAFNDPIVSCCGRDAADCDCEDPSEEGIETSDKDADRGGRNYDHQDPFSWRQAAGPGTMQMAENGDPGGDTGDSVLGDGFGEVDPIAGPSDQMSSTAAWDEAMWEPEITVTAGGLVALVPELLGGGLAAGEAGAAAEEAGSAGGLLNKAREVSKAVPKRTPKQQPTNGQQSEDDSADEQSGSLPWIASTMHETPEPALPSTDGNADDDASEQDLGPTVLGGDIAAAASRSWLNSPSEGDFDLAAGARAFLQKSALKDFTPAEQAALINEGEGVTAANLDRLQIEGTHYEALEAALAANDHEDDNWL